MTPAILAAETHTDRAIEAERIEFRRELARARDLLTVAAGLCDEVLSDSRLSPDDAAGPYALAAALAERLR